VPYGALLKRVLINARRCSASIVYGVKKMVKVLFVCMGNICRSPTAEGVFRNLVSAENLAHQIEIDSAGTHAYHIGNSPDVRSQQAALRRGVDISSSRARRVIAADFSRFDYVLAMDEENLLDMAAVCPVEQRGKAKLLLEFAQHIDERNVPDPYYGGPAGFERVLDLVEIAAAGLLADIRRRHLKG